jgi:molybdate transport system regulatory protein
MKSPTIRLRVDFNMQCAVGPGKIRLLECIAQTGSLSQAAREMEMSYRRAWLLLDSMNASFDMPVVSTQTGGKAGGGAALTAFGKSIITAYRDLELSVSALATKQMAAVTKHVIEHRNTTKRSHSPVSRRRLSAN